MLWQKELNGMYVNLSKSSSYFTENFRFNSKKNNAEEGFTTTNERKNHLESRYGFQYNCYRCQFGLSMVPQYQDSNFKYVRTNVEIGNFDIKSIFEIKKYCIAFILKHPKIFSSVEGNFILR